MSWIDELNNAPDVGSVYQFKPPAAQTKQAPKKKGNFLTSLLPSAGGIGGAAGGAAIGTAILPGIGTILGGLLGGAVGGGAGKVAENATEGQSLGSGVLGEAALNGVLGAGPLRLAKVGIDAARGVKAGVGLTDAVMQAGQRGVNSSIRGAVGNKLTNASNDLAVKDFRLTPAQLTNFKNKFGEDASQVIKKYNLTGKDSETIRQTVMQPLQSEFDTIAAKIPAVPAETVKKAFEAKYSKLLGSAVEDNKAIGQQLKQQADTILNKYGSTIDGKELASLRQEFDSLVSYADKTANPARYGVNKRAADALRGVLQDTADKVGLKASDGKTFKEVGQELNKLHQLTDNISKQENVGRGNLPFSLGNVPGAVIGSTGGLPGAIAGYAVNGAVNSPLGRRALATGTEKVGARLTAKAAARNPYSIPQVAGRILPVGTIGVMGQGLGLESNNNSQTTSTIPTSTNIPTNSNINPLSQTKSNMSSANDPNSPFAPQNVETSVKQIIAKGGTLKDATDFISLADAVQKMSNPASAKLNATQLQQANNANSGLSDLQTLARTIQSDPSVLIKDAIPGGQLARRLTGTNAYDAAKQNIVDVIARLRSGAAITQDEANRYMSLLPTYGDTLESASSKLQRLGSLLSSFANPEAAQPDLASAIQAAQG